MNPEYDSKLKPINEIDLNESGSIDDFIKELEAKERDLCISSELVVEVEEVDAEQAELDELEELLKTLQPNLVPVQPAPSSYHNPQLNKNTFSELEEEVVKLRQQVAKTSAEKSEIQETFRRRQTDFESFRNRTERERSEIFRSVISNLAVKILPAVDNLNRALDSSQYFTTEKSQDFQHFIDGIRMVNHQLNAALKEMGIEPIMSVGEPFDPHYHEAVATVPTDKVPHNTVVEELIRGYHIDNKVIRASMVKVSSSTNSELIQIPLETE